MREPHFPEPGFQPVGHEPEGRITLLGANRFNVQAELFFALAGAPAGPLALVHGQDGSVAVVHAVVGDAAFGPGLVFRRLGFRNGMCGEHFAPDLGAIVQSPARLLQLPIDDPTACVLFRPHNDGRRLPLSPPRIQRNIRVLPHLTPW